MHLALKHNKCQITFPDSSWSLHRFAILSLLHTHFFCQVPRPGGEPCLTLGVSGWILTLRYLLHPPHHHCRRRHCSFLQLAWLSCAANNSLFCGVPCERRHSLSQGRGARGDCWPRASRDTRSILVWEHQSHTDGREKLSIFYLFIFLVLFFSSV